MGRATYLIKTMGGIKYDIYRSTITTDPNSGADIVEYDKIGAVLGYVQPTGSEGNVKGIVLHDDVSGDEAISEYFIYHDVPLENHDRLQYKGLWYELRAVEDWQSSFMKFWKSYLIEVENQ